MIIGVSCFVGSTVSHGCFSILGEAMTQRLRIAILTSMFRQEVGFHDNPENTPGVKRYILFSSIRGGYM